MSKQITLSDIGIRQNGSEEFKGILGFTDASIPNKVSQLENDSGYVNSSEAESVADAKIVDLKNAYIWVNTANGKLVIEGGYTKDVVQIDGISMSYTPSTYA